MGPGPSLVFSVFGATTMGAATWAKQKFHPQPFNLSIKDFVDSVKNRKKFALNEENGHRSCTLINLGLIAMRVHRNLKFDPINQVIVGDDEANRLMDQPMRAPYIL